MSKQKRRKARRKARSRQPDVIFVGLELHGEPIKLHKAEVAELQRQAVDCLHRGEGEEAEAILQAALEREPDAPDLLNNLALAWQLQGRTAETYDLIRRIHHQYPDYLFGRTNMVHLCLRSGNMEQARGLLSPLLLRSRMHFSEFAALCAAQIDLALHEGNRESAETWLEIWEEADPEHPALSRWRKEVRGIRARLARWATGGLRRVAT